VSIGNGESKRCDSRGPSAAAENINGNQKKGNMWGPSNERELKVIDIGTH